MALLCLRFVPATPVPLYVGTDVAEVVPHKRSELDMRDSDTKHAITAQGCHAPPDNSAAFMFVYQWF
jgi:hypothetical protein